MIWNNLYSIHIHPLYIDFLQCGSEKEWIGRPNNMERINIFFLLIFVLFCFFVNFSSIFNNEKRNVLVIGLSIVSCIVDNQLFIMASSNRRTISVQRDATSEHRYFIITLTNHPNLLQRTQQYQQLPNLVISNKL